MVVFAKIIRKQKAKILWQRFVGADGGVAELRGSVSLSTTNSCISCYLTVGSEFYDLRDNKDLRLLTGFPADAGWR